MIPTTDFSVRSLLGGYDNNFTYLITCSRTGAQVIVDAAVEFKNLTPFFRDKPLALLITHTHGDHIAYLDQYLEEFPEIVVLGHPETKIRKESQFKSISHNHNFKIGELHFLALHTPGHYYDSICYKLDSVIFTGDTLFVGRTGRVKSAGSDISDLYDSIYNKLLTLPENTRIYPGHDYGDSPTITIKDNIKISPLLQASDLSDFQQKMENYEQNRKPGT